GDPAAEHLDLADRNFRIELRDHRLQDGRGLQVVLRSEQDERGLGGRAFRAPAGNGVRSVGDVDFTVDPVWEVLREGSFAHVADNADDSPPSLKPARFEMLADSILAGPETLGHGAGDECDPLGAAGGVGVAKGTALQERNSHDVEIVWGEHAFHEHGDVSSGGNGKTFNIGGDGFPVVAEGEAVDGGCGFHSWKSANAIEKLAVEGLAAAGSFAEGLIGSDARGEDVVMLKASVDV